MNRDTDFDTPANMGEDLLLARSETSYDAHGRGYQTMTYAVDASGTVGNALVSNTWYDAAGNAIKQQSAGSGSFTKTAYDGLGRAIKRYLGYTTVTESYSEAQSVANDVLFEQSETTYDEASNVIQTTSRQRLHNATGTGELTSPTGSQPKARVSYTAFWPDPVGRQIAAADYGTNGGDSFSRPDTVPTGSNTVLVTETFFDDAGQAWKTIDAKGREDHRTFDAAGRVTSTIQNYNDSPSGSDENITVETTYNADGLVETLKAINVNSPTDDQVTTYVYGSWIGGITPNIYRADLLRAVIYPDSDDPTDLSGNGTDGIYDRVEFDIIAKVRRSRRPTRTNDSRIRVRWPRPPDRRQGDERG